MAVRGRAFRIWDDCQNNILLPKPVRLLLYNKTVNTKTESIYFLRKQNITKKQETSKTYSVRCIFFLSCNYFLRNHHYPSVHPSLGRWWLDGCHLLHCHTNHSHHTWKDKRTLIKFSINITNINKFVWQEKELQTRVFLLEKLVHSMHVQVFTK